MQPGLRQQAYWSEVLGQTMPNVSRRYRTLVRLQARHLRRNHRPQGGRSVIVLLVLLLLWSLCLGVGLAQATQPRSVNRAFPSSQPTSLIDILDDPAVAPSLPISSLAQNGSSSQPVVSDSTVTPAPTTKPAAAAIGTVDVVAPRLQPGMQLYLENCATCHIALPPEVLPATTWSNLLQDTEHYGTTLRPLSEPQLLLIWNYLRAYSRPLTTGEAVPYRVYQSRFFKALHPRVKLPARAGLNSCVSCHPGADQYDFRSLSSEWQNAP
jgi:hypothetical protein